LLLARLYAAEKDFVGAKREYESVLEQDSNNLVALNDYAWLFRTQDPVRSLRLAIRAAKIAPNSPDVLHTLAEIQSINGMLDEAERSIDKAIVMRPEDPDLQLTRKKIMNARVD
jgi:tetratricopeptide (TPR) repeat protein